MLTGIYQTIPVSIGIITYYVIDTWLVHRFGPKRAIGEKRDWVMTVVILLVVTLIVIQPFALPGLGLNITEWWGLVVQGVGLACFITAMVLIVWVRFHLKQFFSEEVELQPGHSVVKTGPYAWVRHPLYSAFFLGALGMLLINPTIIELLCLCFVLWHFPNRAKQEEALLSRELPGYAEYVAVTPGFVPRFWPRS